jgi:hypothetical protein
VKSNEINKLSCLDIAKPESKIKQNEIKEFYCIIVGFGPNAERRYVPKSTKGRN